MTRFTREEALNELRDMANDCNKVRHRFQAVSPMWKGRPLSDALYDVLEGLEYPPPVAHPNEEVCGCGHTVEAHDESGCVLCGYRCKEGYPVRS